MQSRILSFSRYCIFFLLAKWREKEFDFFFSRRRSSSFPIASLSSFFVFCFSIYCKQVFSSFIFFCVCFVCLILRRFIFRLMGKWWNYTVLKKRTPFIFKNADDDDDDVKAFNYRINLWVQEPFFEWLLVRRKRNELYVIKPETRGEKKITEKDKQDHPYYQNGKWERRERQRKVCMNIPLWLLLKDKSSLPLLFLLHILLQQKAPNWKKNKKLSVLAFYFMKWIFLLFVSSWKKQIFNYLRPQVKPLLFCMQRNKKHISFMQKKVKNSNKSIKIKKKHTSIPKTLSHHTIIQWVESSSCIHCRNAFFPLL